MSCCTKYIKSPLVSFLAGIALGAGSTYYYTQYYTQNTQTKDKKIQQTPNSQSHPTNSQPSGKVIIV